MNQKKRKEEYINLLSSSENSKE